MQKEFFQALQDDRRKLGMSQAEFANALNVSQQTLSKWESGHAMPRTLKLSELLQILKTVLKDDSDTVKILSDWKAINESKLLGGEPESLLIANALRGFSKSREMPISAESSNDSSINYLSVLRENHKNLHRIKMADMLRHTPEPKDPMVIMAKATADLARAADAMQKASESIVKAVQMMQDAEMNKAGKGPA